MSNASDFFIKDGVLRNYNGSGGVVVIPTGVTSIGWGAFKNCKGITEVRIPEGVTEIGYDAFNGCRELAKVTIPQSVTTIRSDAFSATACYQNSANWKKNVFYIDDILIKARQSLSGTYNIEEGTRIIADKAFLKCEMLTTVSIPEGVTDIGSAAFCVCSALTELALPGTVEHIGSEAFSSCDSLSAVRIPGRVKSIGKYAFSNCKALTNVEFSEGASMVGDAMFHDCKMLRRVVLPASMREVCRNAFEYCRGLTEICVAEDNKRFFSVNGALILRDNKELYLAPRGIKGHYEIPQEVNSIGEEAFGGEHLGSGCSNMTGVTLPETVTSIAARAFQCCDGLTNITIPGSTTRIGEWAFSFCQNLSSVTLREGVREIGENTFFGCDRLKTITIPASIEVIQNEAFDRCPSLERFDLAPSSETFSLKGGVLFSRDGSRLLFCPGKLSGSYAIPEGVKSINAHAFDNCGKVEELLLPRGLEVLQFETFRKCKNLTNVSMYDDYPGKNVGNLFGYYSSRLSDTRPLCTVTVRSAQTGEIRYKVRICNESSDINYMLRNSWSVNAVFDFKKLDEYFDGYKDITNRLITAYLRLAYPIDLDEKMKEIYEGVIKRNAYKLIPDLIKEENVKTIKAFLDLGAVSKGKIDLMIEKATELKKAEIAAILIDYKQKNFGESKPSFKLDANQSSKLWETKKGEQDRVWRYNGTDTEVTLPTEWNGRAIFGVADTVFKKPENYQKIEKLVIPDGYRNIGKDAFSGCSGLKEIVFPESLETLGENCFCGCVSLKRIELPDSLQTLGAGCFADCSALEEVRLPAGLQVIPDRTFFQCKKLGGIEFPKSLLAIGDEAFRSCDALKEIELKENFKYLGDKSFYMTRLETVIFRGEKCSAPRGTCFVYPPYVYTDGEINALDIPRSTWMPLSYLGLKSKELVVSADKDFLSGLTVYGCGKLKAFASIISFADFVTALGGTCSNTMKKAVDLVVVYEIDPEDTIVQRAQKQGAAIITELDFLKAIQKNEKLNLDALRADNDKITPSQQSDDPYRPALMKKIWKYTELKDGTICLDSYLGKETDVLIPSRIGDKPVSTIGESALSPEGQHVSNRAGKRAICKVTIPAGVKTIGSSAFEDCENLESITIPESIAAIGACAFQGCSSLKNVRIPDGVKKIGWWTFYDCESLTDVVIPASVTEIDEEAFTSAWEPSCSAVIHAPAGSYAEQYAKEKSIQFAVAEDEIYKTQDKQKEQIESQNTLVKAVDQRKVLQRKDGIKGLNIAIAGTPQDCKNYDELKTVITEKGGNLLSALSEQVDLLIVNDSEADSSTAKKAEELGIEIISEQQFLELAGHVYIVDGTVLTKYYGPGGVAEIPEGVTAIGGSAFENSNIVSITIPESVKSIRGRAFAFCKNLNSIKFPDGLTDIGNHAFYKCTSLKSVIFPNGMTTIGEYTFRNSGLMSVKIPASIKSIGRGAFSACSDLSEIQVEEGNDVYYSVDGVLYQSDIASLIGFPGGKSGLFTIPDGITSIAIHAFSACSKLTGVTIPEGVQQIMDWAFCDCTHLTSVTIPTSVVRIGEGAFFECSELNSAEIPKTVKTICKDAFAFCPKLTIRGEADSKAENYAKKNRISFSAE